MILMCNATRNFIYQIPETRSGAGECYYNSQTPLNHWRIVYTRFVVKLIVSMPLFSFVWQFETISARNISAREGERDVRIVRVRKIAVVDIYVNFDWSICRISDCVSAIEPERLLFCGIKKCECACVCPILFFFFSRIIRTILNYRLRFNFQIYIRIHETGFDAHNLCWPEIFC